VRIGFVLTLRTLCCSIVRVRCAGYHSSCFESVIRGKDGARNKGISWGPFTECKKEKNTFMLLKERSIDAFVSYVVEY
jgi:hypothetical protein